MNKIQKAVENESMPAVDSKQQIKMYSVPIALDIEASLTGYVTVYASSMKEAASKVRNQIEAGTLDGETQMEDVDSGYTISYDELYGFFGSAPDIIERDIQVEDEEVDPDDVLEAEVKQLQAEIVWDSQKQVRLKKFLETLDEAEVLAA
jgi:hypothetical protein